MDTRILADLQAAYGMTVYSMSPCNWRTVQSKRGS
mgnify:CR=1 FL=1